MTCDKGLSRLLELKQIRQLPPNIFQEAAAAAGAGEVGGPGPEVRVAGQGHGAEIGLGQVLGRAVQHVVHGVGQVGLLQLQQFGRGFGHALQKGPAAGEDNPAGQVRVRRLLHGLEGHFEDLLQARLDESQQVLGPYFRLGAPVGLHDGYPLFFIEQGSVADAVFFFKLAGPAGGGAEAVGDVL